MRLYPECMPCFLKRILYEVQLVSKDEKLAVDVMRECSKIIASGGKWGVNSAVLSTQAHKKAYEMLDGADPYLRMKKQSNDVALALYPRAERFVHKSGDHFHAAAVVSIVGNIFDYGITDFRDPRMLYKAFEDLCSEGLGIDDTPAIRKLLQKSKDVLFFTDNCGEIVFDRLLLREMKALGPRITLVAKGVPILSDATREDIHAMDVDAYVDEVIETESFAVGVDLDGASKTFRKRLQEADLIVCKGMANYEIFSDYYGTYRPIAYLMRTKCSPVARSVGAKKDVSVAKLYK